ncbi:hypothetical protein C0583_01135 [Candidatus Parcubacteria bacterium]|nr:MAG: hypothetical protein C0583_01135 [Candidatus Parcubacteria bacterium]
MKSIISFICKWSDKIPGGNHFFGTIFLISLFVAIFISLFGVVVLFFVAPLVLFLYLFGTRLIEGFLTWYRATVKVNQEIFKEMRISKRLGTPDYENEEFEELEKGELDEIG